MGITEFKDLDLAQTDGRDDDLQSRTAAPVRYGLSGAGRVFAKYACTCIIAWAAVFLIIRFQCASWQEVYRASDLWRQLATVLAGIYLVYILREKWFPALRSKRAFYVFLGIFAGVFGLLTVHRGAPGYPLQPGDLSLLFKIVFLALVWSGGSEVIVVFFLELHAIRFPDRIDLAGIRRLRTGVLKDAFRVSLGVGGGLLISEVAILPVGDAVMGLMVLIPAVVVVLGTFFVPVIAMQARAAREVDAWSNEVQQRLDERYEEGLRGNLDFRHVTAEIQFYKLLLRDISEATTFDLPVGSMLWICLICVAVICLPFIVV